MFGVRRFDRIRNDYIRSTCGSKKDMNDKINEHIKLVLSCVKGR